MMGKGIKSNVNMGKEDSNTRAGIMRETFPAEIITQREGDLKESDKFH